MIQPVIAIHGGAGAMSRAAMSPEKEQEYLGALKSIVQAGQAVLAAGGSALDAVTEAVRLLEDCPLFNAGHGSVFTSAATHELDAAIMDGATLRSGAIANVHRVRNPIFAARKENSKHVFFVGGAPRTSPARKGWSWLTRPISRPKPAASSCCACSARRPRPPCWTMTARPWWRAASPRRPTRWTPTRSSARWARWRSTPRATWPRPSTGGITNKQIGRVGDAPLIGAGTYASNKTCAVSATGTGEMFIRMVAAYDVAAQMEYAGASLAQAADSVVMDKLPTIEGKGGLVAVDAQGNVALPFNTEGMYRGYGRVGEAPVVAIYR